MALSREEWLAERRGSIGGSDAAGIMGLSEWSSPYAIWADKTGQLPEKPDNEAMRQGRDLERYVAERWMEETGKRCRRRTQIIKNPAYPFAHANIDRWVVGEKAGLECKTVKPYDAQMYKEGQFPDRFYVQCVHYMAVTGAERWYLAVLVFGTGLYTFTINRDEAEIAALMEAESNFWHYVETRTPPPVDGMPSTTDALQTIYKGGDEEIIDLFGHEDALGRYLKAKEQIKDLQALADAAANEIKSALGNAEAGKCDRANVTWKNQTRSVFDGKRFMQEHPEFDFSGYLKETQTRILRIKEVK